MTRFPDWTACGSAGWPTMCQEEPAVCRFSFKPGLHPQIHTPPGTEEGLKLPAEVFSWDENQQTVGSPWSVVKGRTVHN